MRHLARLGLAALLLASVALVTRADSTSGTSTAPNDFKVILNDPSCSAGADCIQIGYTGQTDLDSLLFLAPNPIQIPAGQTAACGSNFFAQCLVFFPGDGDGDADDFFYGILFFDGTITPGEGLDVGVSGISDFSLVLPSGFECENNACPDGILTFSTPEPSSLLLLIAGLVCLEFVRRRRSPAAAPAFLRHTRAAD